MKTLVTVSNLLILAILEGVSLPETQKLQIANDSGLSMDEVRNANGRTSFVRLNRLWKKILAVTGDDFVGLQIGYTVPAEKFGLVIHASQNSKTFRQALIRFTENARLINDLIKCDLEESGDKASLSMKFQWDIFGLERHAVDLTFSCFRVWSEKTLNQVVPVKEVRLRHSDHSAQARYEEILGAPVVFGAKKNEIIFDSAALDLVNPSANPELGVILDYYAKKEVSKNPAPTDIPAKVCQFIQNTLEAGAPVDLSATADHLKTTARSLQRQLSKASTSFTVLLDETRKALATTLLADPSTNVEQVGMQLGYSEPTAFIRAFKKWYGMTPGEYRRKKTPV